MMATPSAHHSYDAPPKLSVCRPPSPGAIAPVNTHVPHTLELPNVISEDEPSKGRSLAHLVQPGCMTKPKRNCALIISAIVLAVIGLVAGIVVHVKTSSNSSPVPTNSTLSPQEYQARFVATRAALSNFTDPSLFLNPSSPQSEALSWLVYQDQVVQRNSSLAQRYAIMVLFFACSGSSWSGFVTPWNEQVTVDECEFQGIICNNQGEIIALDLSQWRVVGELPDEIGLLTKLSYLDLSSNLLEGALPESMFSMTDMGKWRKMFGKMQVHLYSQTSSRCRQSI